MSRVMIKRNARNFRKHVYEATVKVRALKNVGGCNILNGHHIQEIMGVDKQVSITCPVGMAANSGGMLGGALAGGISILCNSMALAKGEKMWGKPSDALSKIQRTVLFREQVLRQQPL